VFCHQDYPN
jgi:hypothetical protein